MREQTFSIRFMKNFLKYVGATIVGLFIFTVLVAIFGFISLIGMAASSNTKTSFENNSVLVMNLQGEIFEQTQDNWLGRLTGNSFNQMGLNDMMSAIRKAKKNDKIKGIYLEAGLLQTDWATMQELRQALADFKKSGKWIIAYGDRYSQPTYYLCSIADKIYINPEGMVDWHGLSAQPEYYKDLFAKFGVKFSIFKVGKYKSYTEMFTEDKMSDANRIQLTRIVQGIWSQICQTVSQARHISIPQLNQYADEITALDGGKKLMHKKLVDGLLYSDEMRDLVKKKVGLDNDQSIHQVSISDMNNSVDDNTDGGEVAIYYCQGDIVQMGGTSFDGDNNPQIVSSKVIKDLEEMASDDNIKAVVLRINSGGGDAYASEQIWHAVAKLNKKKPVVVSMGGMAASGAYYMSMGARWLVAQPTTETGSIGIFAAMPDISGLLTQKLGIKFDEVSTNRNSTFSMYRPLPMARPYNAAERAALQQYVENGYALFRQRVADGRNMSVAEVQKVAQGHVFLGMDAIRLKLVDQLGGLEDAVKKAASFAKLTDYYTDDYSQPESWIDQLLNNAKGGGTLDGQLRETLGEYYRPFMLLRHMNQREVLQASMPYILNIY